MSKQTAIIVLSIIMFISVWVIVIVQFSTKQEVVPLEVTVVEGESEHERAIPLPNTIEQGSVQEDVNNEEDQTGDLEDPSPSSTNQLQEIEETNNTMGRNEVMDLRLYDFSDISTPAGIPIEGILTKLNLN
ncbi:hypothetical protein RYX56_04035 [Alkalihalophilus lindianensis]|uniref:Uncharacterized protein n=1 Tax=Alkalihalophilus lindianensis TaxID=1630542 RepID=A0ABU3X6K5_9BACI|nr:hypothetical protein [Alkalihalophilus lindianensis]MDV2683542.1 hypothetical protein [Alkalihalophilus lindianensis]